MNAFFPEAVKKGMISPLDSEKIQYIWDQQKKYCCKINSKNGNIGTGFFCKIILPNSLKILPVLMTCNHVLDENDIIIGKSINFSLDNEKHKYEIIIDNKRLVYTNSQMDFTIIQIRQNDNLDINSFLSIEEEVFKGKLINDLIENSICLLHYQNGERAKISFGTIKGISEDNIEIRHNCGTETGSSGGPLLNFMNFKLIGIHKGHKGNKSFNLGTFIKPIIEDFFNNIDFKKINFNDDFENEININNELKNLIKNKEKLINNNIDKSNKIKKNDKIVKDKDNTSIYYLVLFLSILKQFNFFVLMLFIFDQAKVIDFSLFLFIIFICDIFCGIFLKIIQIFFNENHKVILILSFIIQLIPFFPLKVMISSFYQIIPFFNNKILNGIIIGETIGNVYYFNLAKELPQVIKLIIFILTVILTLICIILIIKNWYKLDELKSKEESNINIKFEYFKKNIILNFFLYINYSITFSLAPAFFVIYLYKKSLYIYILSDTIGKLLGKILNENFFKPLILIRYIFCFYLKISFEKKEEFSFNEIFILGLLSGSLTTIGYYIPIQKVNKEEKLSLLYYLRTGKYYVIYLLIGDDKSKSD